MSPLSTRRLAGPEVRVVEVDDWTYWKRPTPQPRRQREERVKPVREREEIVGPRGRGGRDGGRAAVGPQPTVWRGTSGNVAGLYPWVSPKPLPAIGIPIGQDVHSRHTFSCHPAIWTLQKIVYNPNVLITGVPGSGKSALIKTFTLRLIALGVRALVFGDLKGEYNPLAEFLGVSPPVLGPGSAHRVNPLDGGPLAKHLPTDSQERQERLSLVHARRLALLVSLVEFRLERRTTSPEEQALGLALSRAEAFERDKGGEVRDPLIADVLNALWAFNQADAEELHVVGGRDELVRSVHEAGSALETLLTGSLAGLFDGPSTYALDFTAPIQTIDIHRIEGLGPVPVALALSCLSSWGQAAIDDPGRPVEDLRLLVRDEAWRQMQYPALVRKLSSDLRLSRHRGEIQLVGTHRFGDLESSGEAKVAQDLVASFDTKVFLAQDLGPLKVVGESIGLTDAERDAISSWHDARAVGKHLWRVGRRAGFIVEGVLSPLERKLFYTDEKMGGAA